MRVLVDGRTSQLRPAGIGRTLARLLEGVHRVRPEWELDVAFSRRPEQRVAGRQLVVGGWMRRLGPFGDAADHFLWPQLSLARTSVRTSPEVLLCPNFFAPRVARAQCTAVVVWDLGHRLQPPPGAPPFSARDQVYRWHVEHAIRWAVRSAGLIVVPSQATLRDLHRAYGRPRGDTAVMPLAPIVTAPPPGQARPLPESAAALPARYLLCVGARANKNIDTVVAALDHLRPRFPDLELIVTGARRGFGASDDRVSWLGYVDDSTLARLYRGAAVVCHASVMEGFGLPVLEAMQLGTPVVAAAAASIPEIAGDAALLVEPLDAPAWAQAIAAVLTDQPLGERLRERGRQRAALFSWDASARVLAQALEHRLERGPRTA